MVVGDRKMVFELKCVVGESEKLFDWCCEIEREIVKNCLVFVLCIGYID